MTIICALQDTASGKVWLGANSMCAVGDTIVPGTSKAWLPFGNWVFALSGEAVHANFLELVADNAPGSSDSPLDIIKFFKKTYSDFDVGHREENWASLSYEVSGILVHRDGRVWDVDSHLALSLIPSGQLWARGSGMEFALGADYAMAHLSLSAEERVQKAVEAAIHFNVQCPGDAMVETWPKG